MFNGHCRFEIKPVQSTLTFIFYFRTQDKNVAIEISQKGRRSGIYRNKQQFFEQYIATIGKILRDVLTLFNFQSAETDIQESFRKLNKYPSSE